MDVGTRVPLKDSIAPKVLLVVLGLYLLTAVGATLGNIWMEYRYQKLNIIQDLGDIEHAFQNGLAVSLWGLDEDALKASVEGMLRIPTLVGVRIVTDQGQTVAIGGIVTGKRGAGNVGLHVNLSGVSEDDRSIHDGEGYTLEMFERHFPIVYELEGERIRLGRATIYSNGSVIYRRMKLQGTMLTVNVLLTLLTFSVALLWAVNRYLRRPLRILTDATSKISLDNLGSFSVDTKTNGRNEIKVLEKAINSMVVDLHDAVSKREEMEKARRESEEHLQAILDNTSAVVCLKDTRGAYLTINRRFEELFHVSRSEIIGKTDHDIFPSEKANAFVAHDRLVVEEGRALQMEEVAPHDDGDHTYISVKFPLYDEKHTIYAVGGISTDITEKIQAEQELLKVKKLESLGVLAGGIAHDFNNILMAILANLNLALCDEALNEDTKHLLSDAEKASLRAKKLTQQLLTFSKGGEPVKEASSLENVIKDSAEFVLHGDRVVCSYDLPEDLRLVDIDKGQISQVIQNIVLNASHAMPEGGQIAVSAENVSSASGEALPFGQNGEFVKICIRDSGVGMPANVVEKIFEPYYSTKQGGSGLGLAITRSIIDKHNGHIYVESSPGSGTTLTIYLPTSAQKPAEEEEKTSASEKVSTWARILVLEDEEIVGKVAKAMLEKLGHEVILSKDGEETISLYQESMNAGEVFDLVIMDLTIPGGMGGKEAVRRILAIDPKAKAIVSSGYSNDPILANFESYGFCAAIAKPYRLQDLSSVINRLIE